MDDLDKFIYHLELALALYDNSPEITLVNVLAHIGRKAEWEANAIESFVISLEGNKRFQYDEVAKS